MTSIVVFFAGVIFFFSSAYYLTVEIGYQVLKYIDYRI